MTRVADELTEDTLLREGIVEFVNGSVRLVDGHEIVCGGFDTEARAMRILVERTTDPVLGTQYPAGLSVDTVSLGPGQWEVRKG